ncbi:alpha/beta fold hydrolase [Pseudomonas sp. KNUC1026]|uniref:alpha/beta fold hydrolase n=1 Tax=Pseudomonas sp. KNUC1026 TaxID=2893890 RepID=UPI001F228E8E|nr:alpha/beta fold hydrolase [Pseudomonas sp. KNUC1026]UFH51102.1 alpha/beta hydrolase [Pseudomonas sp. KNUC1026]
MAWFTHQAASLYYLDINPRAARCVVLLHGLTNSGRAWAPQLPALTAAGYRVIVPDLLGHGASSPATQTFTPAEQASQLHALLHHIGVPQASVVGLSLGGMVALSWALIAPEQVQRLVVAGSFGHLQTPQLQTMLHAWKAEFCAEGGAVQRFEQSWPLLVGDAFAASEAGLSWYQAWHAQAAQAHGESLAYWCQGMHSYDLREALPALAMPTLVLSSSEDLISPPAEGSWIAERIQPARHTVLPGAGHVFNVPLAKAFNQAVLEFLSEGHADAY